MRSIKNYAKTIPLLATLFFLCLPVGARADDIQESLPASILAHASTPLKETGKSTFRRFGLRVYVASLWTKDGTWDVNKPYALALRYTRGVSKDTMVDIVIGDIRDQNVADDATLTRWQGILNQDLPAVADGDVLVGLAIPGKKSLLFYNGKQIASLDDAALSQAFFNVWLGKTADEDMRAELLGKPE